MLMYIAWIRAADLLGKCTETKHGQNAYFVLEDIHVFALSDASIGAITMKVTLPRSVLLPSDSTTGALAAAPRHPTRPKHWTLRSSALLWHASPG